MKNNKGIELLRKWCSCQIKCKEDNERTWTCTANLAEGIVLKCFKTPNEVFVDKDGYYKCGIFGKGRCEDFEPPGYDCNDPNKFGGREKD